MQGNLDLTAAYKLLFGTTSSDVMIKGMPGAKIYFRNALDSAYAHTYQSKANVYNIDSLATGDAYFSTKNRSTSAWIFQSIGTGGWLTSMILTNRSLRMPNLPTADPADGTSTLWMDIATARVIKIGT